MAPSPPLLLLALLPSTLATTSFSPVGTFWRAASQTVTAPPFYKKVGQGSRVGDASAKVAGTVILCDVSFQTDLAR